MNTSLLPIVHTDGTVAAENIQSNFYLLMDSLSAIASDPGLTSQLSTSEILQQGVSAILAMDRVVFLATLASSLSEDDDFISSIVGSTDGLVNNFEFIDAVAESIYSLTSFWSAFLVYLEDNNNTLRDYFDASVFNAYFYELSESFPLNTPIALIEPGEDPLTIAGATDYLGLFLQGSDFSILSTNANFYVSKDISFPVGADTLKFTIDGTGSGTISGGIFSVGSGFNLIDITSLSWDGIEPIYVKLTVDNDDLTGIEYVQIFFDYTRSQTHVAVEASSSSDFRVVDINDSDMFDLYFGKEGNPEASINYDGSLGEIVFEEGLLLRIHPPKGSTAGAGWAVLGFSRPAYTYYNRVRLKSHVNIELVGGTVLLQGSHSARFLVGDSTEPVSSASMSTDRTLEVFQLGSGVTFKSGDVVSFYLNEGPVDHTNIFNVLSVDTSGANPILTLSRKITIDDPGIAGRLVKVPHDIKFIGGMFYGLGYSAIDSPDRGGFMGVSVAGNLTVESSIVNFASKISGGAIYAEVCRGLVCGLISMCQSGEGAAIFQCAEVTAKISDCYSFTTGGLVAYINGGSITIVSSDVPLSERFLNCTAIETTDLKTGIVKSRGARVVTAASPDHGIRIHYSTSFPDPEDGEDGDLWIVHT
jgi:hypothetical protein